MQKNVISNCFWNFSESLSKVQYKIFDFIDLRFIRLWLDSLKHGFLIDLGMQALLSIGSKNVFENWIFS